MDKKENKMTSQEYESSVKDACHKADSAISALEKAAKVASSQSVQEVLSSNKNEISHRLGMELSGLADTFFGLPKQEEPAE